MISTSGQLSLSRLRLQPLMTIDASSSKDPDDVVVVVVVVDDVVVVDVQLPVVGAALLVDFDLVVDFVKECDERSR